MTSPADNFTKPAPDTGERTFVDALLDEQRQLTAVEAFARAHERHELTEPRYRKLLPASPPRPGEQYAFEVNLDQCSGCQACVTACHSLNGLDDGEAWREVGALFGEMRSAAVSQTSRSRSDNAATGLQHNRAPFPTDGVAPRTPQTPEPRPYSLPLHQTVTTACHHCIEPGCLSGCPVLAYDKDPVTGIVRHLDDQCIGCSYCILKCPYDVPKYSATRGIVRKCDMCQGRLAASEAPACVQACPNEAIRISVVSTAAVTATFRSVGADAGEKVGRCESETASISLSHSPTFSPAPTWLPDAPAPHITLPTTRYVTTKPAADLRAADHNQPRPQPAHWPLILMLVLTQAGIGGLLADAALRASGAGVPPALVNQASRLVEATPIETIGRLVAAGTAAPLALASLALLFAGLTASVFHLGQPLKAWRIWLGWRTSWLSREAIALNAFAGVAVASVATALLRIPQLQLPISYLLPLLALAAVFAQAMVYADTHRAFWSLPRTAPRFFGSVVVLGLSLALVAEVLSPLRGSTGLSASASTGSAALHPWLLSAAPIGAGPDVHGAAVDEDAVGPSANNGAMGTHRTAPGARSESSEGASESSHGWSAAKPVETNDETSPPRRGGGISLLATALLLATLLKLACELSILKHADSDSDLWTQLRRTAALQTGALRPVLAARLLAALVGGVFIPFAIATGGATAALTLSAFALCLLGELAERHLFFTSVAPDKMPV